ncbi:Uncharacterised protein [Mycobacteroides abscessus subsp. abscessus]|nr:Uncharacterised protein [Mycobacteroides abscessus subsp. abscessus]
MVAGYWRGKSVGASSSGPTGPAGARTALAGVGVAGWAEPEASTADPSMARVHAGAMAAQHPATTIVATSRDAVTVTCCHRYRPGPRRRARDSGGTTVHIAVTRRACTIRRIGV